VRSRTNSASARPDPLDRRTPAPPRPSRTGEPFATSRSPLPPPPRTAPSHCARASDVAHRTFIFLFHLAGPAAPSSHPPPLCHTHTHTHTHRERDIRRSRHHHPSTVTTTASTTASTTAATATVDANAVANAVASTPSPLRSRPYALALTSRPYISPLHLARLKCLLNFLRPCAHAA
jgi:hypothetical protein